MGRFGLKQAVIGFSVGLLALLLPASVHAQGGDERPTLPDEQLYETEHFLIHYTLSGENAIPSDDEDENGLPDYVTFIAETLEEVWTVEIEEMGWAMPPSDMGKGGDDRLDVYLIDILYTGIAGFVSTSEGLIGDNPNTPEIERSAAFSFMGLDNDYAEVFNADSQAPSDYDRTFAQGTIAHEFHHMVQMGYDSEDPHQWFYESSSMWVEDEVYDTLNDSVEYLPFAVKNPDICIVSPEGREAHGLRWYGSWLFLRHLSESYGQETIRAIWEESRYQSTFTAMDTVLTGLGTSLELERRTYFIRTLLRDYEEGELYPTIRLEGEISTGQFIPDDGVQSLGADVIRIVGDDPVTISAILTGDEPISLGVVGVRSDGTADSYYSPTGLLHIDLGPYETAFALVYNETRTIQPSDCAFVRYRLDVVASRNASGYYDEPLDTYSAENFLPPIVEDVPSELPPNLRDRPLFDAPPNGTYSEYPTGIVVSFDPVVPPNLLIPEGFAFDFATARQGSDYGFLGPYYVPDGEDAAVYDYTTPTGGWIGITQSITEIEDLQSWLDMTGYNSPGEMIQINDIDVLLEDLSESGETWISATFIIEDRFFVVDASTNEEDVLDMVRALIDVVQADDYKDQSILPLYGGSSPNVNPLPDTTTLPELNLRSNVFSQLALTASCIYIGLVVVLIVLAIVFINRRVIPR